MWLNVVAGVLTASNSVAEGRARGGGRRQTTVVDRGAMMLEGGEGGGREGGGVLMRTRETYICTCTRNSHSLRQLNRMQQRDGKVFEHTPNNHQTLKSRGTHRRC